jgi:hypothetical protein
VAEEESQAIEGYGCQCGYTTDDLDNLRNHLMQEGRKDGKGVHKSLGRINILTGDVVLPPWNERTHAERMASSVGVKQGGVKLSPVGGISPNRQTDSLSEASEIKFVPRVYTATLSPILQTAYVAAQRAWGWRPEMPFINFLDTVVYNYFKEHGCILAAYIIEPPENDNGNDNGNGNGNGEIHGAPDGTPGNLEVMTEKPIASDISDSVPPPTPKAAPPAQKPAPAQKTAPVQKTLPIQKPAPPTRIVIPEPVENPKKKTGKVERGITYIQDLANFKNPVPVEPEEGEGEEPEEGEGEDE